MIPNANKLTIEDVLRNPHKYGAPTFEEFQRNPSLWKKRTDESMIAITDGPEAHRKDLKSIKFFVNGLELSSENEVERALSDYGYGLEDIDLTNRDSRLKKEIKMVPIGGGLAHDVHVNFLP